MALIIREIKKEDNSLIASVIRRVFEEDNYPKVGTAYADSCLDELFEVYSSPKSIYFVVESDGNIVGGGGLSQLENSDLNYCELQKMYFLTEIRGKGIGLQLIQKCLQKAVEFGYEKCYLETLPVMVNAQNLYKKVGFEYICAPLGGTGHTSCPTWMLLDLN